MECVLQWLDNLDDYVTALPLQVERLRRLALRVLMLSLWLAVLAVLVAAMLAVPALGPVLAALLLGSVLWQRAQAARRLEDLQG